MLTPKAEKDLSADVCHSVEAANLTAPERETGRLAAPTDPLACVAEPVRNGLRGWPSGPTCPFVRRNGLRMRGCTRRRRLEHTARAASTAKPGPAGTVR